jgi:hypothetical protein
MIIGQVVGHLDEVRPPDDLLADLVDGHREPLVELAGNT